MLEKAELTLIKMLSKTKKVFTTPLPVLCSIASYSYFTRKVRSWKIFHYYLCRRLKGGGMEIIMYKSRTIYYPQSEIHTPLIPVASGCPHNKCKFCSMFKDQPYEELPIDEIEYELKN